MSEENDVPLSGCARLLLLLTEGVACTASHVWYWKSLNALNTSSREHVSDEELPQMKLNSWTTITSKSLQSLTPHESISKATLQQVKQQIEQAVTKAMF